MESTKIRSFCLPWDISHDGHFNERSLQVLMIVAIRWLYSFQLIAFGMSGASGRTVIGRVVMDGKKELGHKKKKCMEDFLALVVLMIGDLATTDHAQVLTLHRYRVFANYRDSMFYKTFYRQSNSRMKLWNREWVKLTKIICFILVDCAWNEWGEWQNCNVTCGDGWNLRTRTQEPELYGGESCKGSPEDWTQCFSRHCPSKTL